LLFILLLMLILLINSWVIFTNILWATLRWNFYITFWTVFDVNVSKYTSNQCSCIWVKHELCCEFSVQMLVKSTEKLHTTISIKKLLVKCLRNWTLEEPFVEVKSVNILTLKNENVLQVSDVSFCSVSYKLGIHWKKTQLHTNETFWYKEWTLKFCLLSWWACIIYVTQHV